jgi:hypothetical protein
MYSDPEVADGQIAVADESEFVVMLSVARAH